MKQHVIILIWYKYQATSGFAFISHIESSFPQSINKYSTLLATFKKGIRHE